MERILKTLMAVGFLIANPLVSGHWEANEGTDVTLSFQFQPPPESPIRTISWLKIVNGHPTTIATYHGSGDISPNYLYKDRVWTTNTPWQLQLFNITLSDAGLYKCILKVTVREWLEERAATNTLQVFGIRKPVLSPAENENVPRGGTVTLRCQVESHPTAQLSWVKDGLLIRNATGNNDTFTVSSFQCENMGLYTCRARNERVDKFTVTSTHLRNKETCSSTTTTTSTTIATTATTITATTTTTTATTATSTTTTLATDNPVLSVSKLSPNAAPQTPFHLTREQSKDSTFENSLMSTITFSSISTTAALATLFMFVTIALCCRRRRRRRRRLEHSYASLMAMSERSEGDSMACNQSCHVTAVQSGVCRVCSRLSSARRPLPLLPAHCRERPPCPLPTSTRQGETNASESTEAAYRSCSVVDPRGASSGSHNPPPRCGFSRQLPPSSSTPLIQSYFEVDREAPDWNRTPSVMDSQGSALNETRV